MIKIKYPRVRFLAAVFAVFLFLGISGNAYADELLRDAGFDLSTPNGTFPNSGYWTPATSGGTSGALCTSTAARSGSCGLWAYTANVSGLTWAGPYQQYAAVPGQAATGSAWIRTPPPGTGVTWANGSKACVRIEFLNSGGSVLASKDSNAVTQANSGWTYCTITTSQAPAGTVKARYRCYVEKPSNGIAVKSVVNFDDCSLSLSATPDKTPPTGTISINNGSAYTNTAAVTLTLSATDSGSGMGTVAQMQFSNNNSTWSTAEAYSITKSWTLAAGDGTKTVYVKFKDAAGNWSGAYSDTIKLDTKAPTGTISINNNAASTTSVNVTLTLSASDTGSGISQMQFSNNSSTWSTAEPYAAAKSWTLTSGAGTKYVYVRFSDNAGNWSGAVKDSITLAADTTPPTGTISINNGSAYTNTAAVTLTLSATDAGSGMGTGAQMQFSNNNSTWSTAAAYATTKSWTLAAGDGTKTVYVKFKDAAGNWSGAVSKTIILDTIPPSIVITSPQDNSVVKTSPVTVYYTVDGAAKSKQFALSAGKNVLTVTEQDAAGNVGSVSITVTYLAVIQYPSIVTTDGYRIMVQNRKNDGTLAAAVPYVVKGVCWSPASIGTIGPNYDEAGMRSELGKWADTDIPLISGMNANTIRTFQDFGLTGDYPIKDWKYILDECYANNIMVIVTVDRCIGDTTRIKNIVTQYKNHPAILMWLVGNEWPINMLYGAYPDISSCASAVQTAAQLIKTLDQNHPVATSLGDINSPSLGVITDIISKKCPSVDVWCFNLYRGKNFGNLFDQWRDVALSYTAKPMVITEFGCDAYDSDLNKEDDTGQRTYEYYQWQDIAKNLSADDPSRTCSGGCVFEFNDEWWKTGSPFTQDTGGWATNNCPDGFASEEWWGLVDINRNPRPAYQLFQEYFGGLVPQPPSLPADDYNVVRFSTQPDTITTNISTYVIADVFKDAYQVSVNGTAVTLDYYYGFTKDAHLTAGTNSFTMDVVFKDGTEKTYQKSVIYDPNYSTAVKRLIYVDDIAIDLDAGACLGRLPVAVKAITHDGKFFIDQNANVYSTSNNQPVGKRLNLNSGTTHSPLFSNNDSTVYSHTQALDFAANTLLPGSLPIDVTDGTCSIDANGYIYYINNNQLTKVDPSTFAVLKSITSSVFYGFNSCISKDGALAFGDVYSYAAGTLNIMDVGTAANTPINSLSDYTGDIVSSLDGSRILLGSYGNSYYGKGGVYMVDKNSKTLCGFYHQYGARRLTVSADSVFATSTIVDHFQDGSIVQGSPYHRGIEVLALYSSPALEYQKSFFLNIAQNYSISVKIFYKPAND